MKFTLRNAENACGAAFGGLQLELLWPEIDAVPYGGGVPLQVLLGLLWPEIHAVPYGGGVHLQVLLGLLWPEIDAAIAEITCCECLAACNC